MRHRHRRRRHADADVDPQAAGLRRRRRSGRWSTWSTAGRRGRGRTAGAIRWNPQLWAAQGYVVALPNPRGSTGFGQKYVDEISGDWGGKCYDDLMAGVDYLEKLPYIDKDRMAAAGASFGGYMMNWFAGQHRQVQDAHHALRRLQLRQHVRHDRRAVVRRMGARRPALGQEPRVLRKALAAPLRQELQDADADHPQRPRLPLPVGEGHQLFTTLQRLGVPSKFINFPDEGHWVLKPANSEYWHKEVFAWLEKYCPPGEVMDPLTKASSNAHGCSPQTA